MGISVSVISSVVGCLVLGFDDLLILNIIE